MGGPRQVLPVKQAAVMEFIQTELTARAGFPTPQRIATYMGWKNDTSARDCLERLRLRGLLAYDRETRRFRRTDAAWQK